jgi:hypothetical protein
LAICAAFGFGFIVIGDHPVEVVKRERAVISLFIHKPMRIDFSEYFPVPGFEQEHEQRIAELM